MDPNKLKRKQIIVVKVGQKWAGHFGHILEIARKIFKIFDGEIFSTIKLRISVMNIDKLLTIAKNVDSNDKNRIAKANISKFFFKNELFLPKYSAQNIVKQSITHRNALFLFSSNICSVLLLSRLIEIWPHNENYN